LLGVLRGFVMSCVAAVIAAKAVGRVAKFLAAAITGSSGKRSKLSTAPEPGDADEGFS
jgi:hypothetical protein